MTHKNLNFSTDWGYISVIDAKTSSNITSQVLCISYARALMELKARIISHDSYEWIKLLFIVK